LKIATLLGPMLSSKGGFGKNWVLGKTQLRRGGCTKQGKKGGEGENVIIKSLWTQKVCFETGEMGQNKKGKKDSIQTHLPSRRGIVGVLTWGGQKNGRNKTFLAQRGKSTPYRLPISKKKEWSGRQPRTQKVGPKATHPAWGGEGHQAASVTLKK